MHVAGRVIVITGAANGVGAAAAQRFVAEGATIVLTDVDAQPLAELAERMDCACFAGDIRREETVRSVADLARSRHGRIDIWFSNAGWAGPAEPAEAPAIADWQRMWELHVMAHVHAVREVLPEMLRRGEGYLLQTASSVALSMQPVKASYTVTKHAALSYGEWLAANVRRSGVRVSCFCPGPMDTRMFRENGFPADHPIVQRALGMEAVADLLIQGIAAERFLIDEHGPAESVADFVSKGRDYDGWLDTMGIALGGR